jgi:hypothetical protein
MQSKTIILTFLTLVASLLLIAVLTASPSSLAAEPSPTATPQVVRLSHPISLDLTAPPTLGRERGARIQLDPPDASSPAVQPAAPTSSSNGGGWQRIMAQDFEGSFPPPGWVLYDVSSTDGGIYFWGQRDCNVLSGSYSAWAGGGGTDGASLACTETYTNNLETWLDSSPVDLSQATAAELQFGLWTDIEGDGPPPLDSVSFMASLDGITYYGYYTNQETGDWIPASLDLTQIPPLGDLTGQPVVYLSWVFESNASNPTAYEGAFVDDAALWVYTPPSPTPPPPTATLPITCHTTLADFAGGRSHDGTMVQIQQGDGALALAAQVDTVGTWDRLPSLPRELVGFAAVAAQGHLFILGGNGLDGYEQRVYSATIHEGGLLDRWQEATPLPQALVGLRAVVTNGHLFVVGGVNAFGFQNTVFSAPIHPDGSLGQWSTLPALPEPLALSGVVAAQGYLYVLGGQGPGFTVSDRVYRAAINAD